MPKRKRISPKTFAGAVRYAKRKRYARGSTAKRALSMAKQVKRLVNKTIENKQISWKQSTTVSTAGYRNYGFITIAQGVTDGDGQGSAARIGNKVTLMSMNWKFGFQIPDASESNNKIRVLLVESTEGAVALSKEDILKYHNYTTDGNQVFISPYTTKTDTNKRYKVHMDRTFSMSLYKNPSIRFSHKITFGKTGRVINFNDQYTGPVDCKFTLIAISDSTVATHPTMDANMKLVYKDA